jgi:hypothetical protein
MVLEHECQDTEVLVVRSETDYVQAFVIVEAFVSLVLRDEAVAALVLAMAAVARDEEVFHGDEVIAQVEEFLDDVEECVDLVQMNAMLQNVFAPTTLCNVVVEILYWVRLHLETTAPA